ncbi:MAG: DUF2804 domain-containing protein [Treponema sp.]|jgi:hypothetical protein|nr:DUF2804 domain-containing protein [Treponema sp.]
MYTRDILPPVASPVEDGNPLSGTWNKAFEKVDLLEIRRPYRYPVPRWARDYRIKERQCFSVQDDNLMLEVVFYNFKLYRMFQVFLYDKDSGQKFIFRKIKPGGRHFPNSLANSSQDVHSSGFYFRIHSWLDADTIRLDINIEAAFRKPSLTVHLAYNVNSCDVTPMAVSMGAADRRIIYAYKTFAGVRGDIVFGGRHVVLNQKTSSGFFCDYKGFYPYNMQTTICSAMGFVPENRRFGFHIAENHTRETNRNNENALWVDGKLTPLPPVLITMPNGPDADWIIQDVEGMVDLMFTPKEHNKSRINLFFTKAEFNAPFGLYNGMLVSSEREQIQIKNLYGVGEKFNLRV